MKKMVVFVTLMFVASAAFAGDQDFTLVNETGLAIVEFYCSATTTNNWEEDILGVDILEDGDDVNIAFSHDEEACDWDFMIVDEDGDKIYWTGIDLCETESVTLYYEDGVPTADIQKVSDEDEEEDEE